MRTSLLPENLTQALARVGDQLQAGKSLEDCLPPALGLLETLPPHLAIVAGGQIAEAAKLYRRQPDDSILALFTRRLSDKEQLLRFRGSEKLFIFHFDGRIREAALQRITGPISSAFLFAAIAWRLNDWVEQVRSAATACAARTFNQTSPSIIAQAAKILMLREYTWQRWDKERGVLWDCFARNDVAEAMANDLISAQQGPSARILRQALKQPSIDSHLDGIAQSAVQPGARAAALQTLLAGEAKWPNGWEYYWIDKSLGRRGTRTKYETRPIEQRDGQDTPGLIVRGLHDLSAMVRRVAAQALIDRGVEIPDARNLASELLKDRSPAVRERAAYLLRDDAA